MTYRRTDQDRSDITDRLERVRRVRWEMLPGSLEDEDARREAAYLQRELHDRSEPEASAPERRSA